MEYREIVSVTGLGGLYQLLATKSDGAIVRDLADKSTRFISSRLHSVTPLESIEVYTTNDNIRLHNVFIAMKEKEDSQKRPDPKTADNNAIKGYFRSAFPDFDEERVYVSDMKKMLKWYDILKANDLLHFERQLGITEETPAEVQPEAEAVVAEETEPAKKAPKKKATKKKTEE